jgi:hypothetical protein
MSSLKLSTFRLIGSAVLLSSCLLPLAASAQSQSDNTSVADAARRAREQKKNATKPARTLTNDDLPAAPAATAPPVVAPATESTAASDQSKPEEPGAPLKAAAPAEPAAQAGTASKRRVEAEAALKRAKAELTQAQGELDVLGRKAALDSDAYYSKTDYARDTEGKARLDADTQQVNDKKSQVDVLKAKVAALQSELGQASDPERPAQPR